MTSKFENWTHITIPIPWAAAIAPWFRLCLHPVALYSNPNHTIFAFSIWRIEIVTRKRTKINKKRPGLAQKQYQYLFYCTSLVLKLNVPTYLIGFYYLPPKLCSIPESVFCVGRDPTFSKFLIIFAYDYSLCISPSIHAIQLQLYTVSLPLMY